MVEKVGHRNCLLVESVLSPKEAQRIERHRLGGRQFTACRGPWSESAISAAPFPAIDRAPTAPRQRTRSAESWGERAFDNHRRMRRGFFPRGLSNARPPAGVTRGPMLRA